jgi:aminoglycoside phosphotransferase (APT) family kinase protein
MSVTGELLDQPQKTEVLAELWRFSTPDWLAAVVETGRVRAALMRHVREFTSGELTIRDCQIKRLRLKDKSGYWSGTYLLTVEGLPAGQTQVVSLHGTLIPPGFDSQLTTRGSQPPFGAEGWHCYLPELRLELEIQSSDTELPVLPILTDPEQARSLLEQSIRAGAPAYRDLHLQTCTPKIMRYKPGSRCTILYQLEYPAELATGRNWPNIVVAKTYHGDKGQNAYSAMQALWDSPLSKSSAVAIAEPLAYLPEMNVLLQGPIREETTLKKLIRSALHANTPEAIEQLHDYIRKTAAGLAELHQCGVKYGQAMTWQDEFEDTRQRFDRLTIPIPQLTGATMLLLSRLEALAAAYPPDPLAPAHRSFRPAQVLLYKGEIGFIDFDGFCQAEPALDVALFMVTMRQAGLTKVDVDENNDEELIDEETRRSRLAQTEAMCDLFLSTYEALAPISRQRVVLWEALYLFAAVLGCWTKLKTTRLPNRMLLLERHLQVHGLDKV